jgi:hypothetical protein
MSAIDLEETAMEEGHPLQENFDRFKKKIEENTPFHGILTILFPMVTL